MPMPIYKKNLLHNLIEQLPGHANTSLKPMTNNNQSKTDNLYVYLPFEIEFDYCSYNELLSLTLHNGKMSLSDFFFHFSWINDSP